MINIFILNWKSAGDVRECLNSIVASDEKDYRILLINNYSDNQDLEDVRALYDFYRASSDIYLVENSSNYGYAGGNNAGLNFLKSKNLDGDILILNPDIIISENTLSEMKHALTEDIGIVTVRTVNPSGKILFDSIKIHGFRQIKKITNKKYVLTDYSQGSCMLIARQIINTIGLFDERFFLYWEEVDFSLRVRSLGKKLISVTSTIIIRKDNNQGRKPEVFYYSVRNARLVREKHPDFFSVNSYRLYLVRIILMIFGYILKPKLCIRLMCCYFTALYDSKNNIYFRKLKL